MSCRLNLRISNRTVCKHYIKHSTVFYKTLLIHPATVINILTLVYLYPSVSIYQLNCNSKFASL